LDRLIDPVETIRKATGLPVMVNRTPLDPKKELLISAVMRMVFPDRLIPASLDVGGLAGLKQRLEAGATWSLPSCPREEGWPVWTGIPWILKKANAPLPP